MKSLVHNELTIVTHEAIRFECRLHCQEAESRSCSVICVYKHLGWVKEHEVGAVEWILHLLNSLILKEDMIVL